MTYEETRDSEQLRFLDGAIELFVARYKLRPSDAPRQTVIFFPGGLASKLMRATTPYRSDITDPQTFDYQEIWLSLWTFGHPELNALKLKMHRDAKDGAYHDEDDRIIVANGSIEFGGITPYDDFVDWCRDNNIDLFVFGWDWRRRLEETVTFFLRKFLPHFRQVVMDRCNGADPLQKFTLVGHSFGGLIVNLLLRASDPLADRMNKAITVATPFYGYAGQIHRWFEGVELLNHLGKAELIKTLASLPASYTLNWLDKDTFDTNENAFKADPDFSLPRYPSRDLRDRTQPADPYNPQDSGGRVRYPRNLGFDPQELQHGLDVYRNFVEPLPANLANKFFNIRGVQLNLDETLCRATADNTTWDLIDPNFDPNQKSPIADGAPGPGDEVLPAWSTHLLTLPANNRRTIKGLLHHAFIMSSPSLQQELGALLGVAPTSPPAKPAAPQDEAAKPEEVVDFVHRLHDVVNALPLDQLKPESLHLDAVFESVLGGVAAFRGLFSKDSRRRVAYRIIMELLK